MIDRVSQSPEMPKVTITAFVEEELKRDLQALADVERRSMSQLVALLVERAIAEAKAAGVIPADSTK